MTTSIVAAATALDALQIHHATCRARRQQLCCSTCTDLALRAARHAVKQRGGAPLCERARSFPVGRIAARRYRMAGVTCSACLAAAEAA